MFILTTKINKRKIAALLMAALAICAAAWAAAIFLPRTASAAAEVSPKRIKTAEDRVNYLQAWGWVVSPEATLVEELQIPEELGSEYDKYLALQSDQGFDLGKYAGKRIKRYTYDVLNYPNGEAGVTAHLLIYKNTVIAGEIMGPHFLHGLAMPE